MFAAQYYVKFRAIIFDLDHTLWDGKKLYKDVPKIIDFCKTNDIKLFIVSFNKNATNICHDYLKIGSHFSLICYVDSKAESKSRVVQQILEDFNILKQEVIFYDDDLYNVIDVYEQVNICSIHVPSGIKWEHIPILKRLAISGEKSPGYKGAPYIDILTPIQE